MAAVTLNAPAASPEATPHVSSIVRAGVFRNNLRLSQISQSGGRLRLPAFSAWSSAGRTPRLGRACRPSSPAAGDVLGPATPKVRSRRHGCDASVWD